MRLHPVCGASTTAERASLSAFSPLSGRLSAAALVPDTAPFRQHVADRQARDREHDEDDKNDMQRVAEFVHQRRERLGRQGRALLRRQDARQQSALALEIAREAEVEDAAESRGADRLAENAREDE